jgi:hypothetical protein
MGTDYLLNSRMPSFDIWALALGFECCGAALAII